MREKPSPFCLVDGCGATSRARNLCIPHWTRARRGEIPLPPTLKNKLPKPVCSVGGCNKTIRTFESGLCESHWRFNKLYGTAESPHPKLVCDGLSCSVDGCERPRKGDGLCGMHYGRRDRTGDVGEASSRQGPRGSGTITHGGYRKIWHDGRLLLEHRVVMASTIGRPLKRHEEVHHKDGDKLNNSPSNLELWSHSQPPGQRVADKIAFCQSFLKEYGIDVHTPNASDFLSGAMACV